MILNKLYFDLQRKISTALANALYSIQNVYLKMYTNVINSQYSDQSFLENKAKLEAFVKNSAHFEQLMLHLMVMYRRRFYALGKASEMEAIGRVTPKKKRLNVTKQELWDRGKMKSKQGHSLDSLVHIGVSRQFHKAIEAFQSAFLQHADPNRALEIYASKMPKVKRKKKQLRNVESVSKINWKAELIPFMTFHEAKDEDRRRTNEQKIKDIAAGNRTDYETESAIDQAPDFSFTAGVIDEEAFNDIRDAYAEEFVPNYAFRDERLKWEVPSADGEETQEIYGWEVERSITNDFVMQVRDGQNEAATEAGINDFIWMTVLSEATCEDCAWRDGLTSTEIESKLNEMGDDESDSVPPEHPNCYCTISPYGDDIGKYEKDVPTIGSAEEWLNDLANQ